MKSQLNEERNTESGQASHDAAGNGAPRPEGTMEAVGDAGAGERGEGDEGDKDTARRYRLKAGAVPDVEGEWGAGSSDASRGVQVHAGIIQGDGVGAGTVETYGRSVDLSGTGGEAAPAAEESDSNVVSPACGMR